MLFRPSPAAQRRPPGFIEPCIPTLASRPPVGPQWIHEIKHDGYRLIARKRDGRVRQLSDPHENIALKVLCEMWISLANESLGFSECDLTKQIAAIEELQRAVTNHGRTPVP
jgi:hypothetical protein